MKPMSDRKMDMKRGEPDSFFPDAAEKKELKRPGEIKGFKYPDTEEAIMKAQEDSIRGISRDMPKPEFRH